MKELQFNLGMKLLEQNGVQAILLNDKGCKFWALISPLVPESQKKKREVTCCKYGKRSRGNKLNSCYQLFLYT